MDDIGVALVVDPIFGQRGSSEPKYLCNKETVLICVDKHYPQDLPNESTTDRHSNLGVCLVDA